MRSSTILLIALGALIILVFAIRFAIRFAE
jgi:hypothetical protein